jgi:hypothetical protein
MNQICPQKTESSTSASEQSAEDQRLERRRVLRAEMDRLVAARNGPMCSPEDNDLLAWVWTVPLRKKDCLYYRRYSYGKQYYVHRLIGARIAGRPLLRTDVVDHRNGNTLDNRRENLRIVTPLQNSQNRDRENPYRGTTKLRNGKWLASVKCNGKVFYCGTFVSREDAAKAAAAKRTELNFCTPTFP